jgi:hypothetical protein
MPGEGALKLNQFEKLSVELARDARIPVIFDQGELLGEIDLLHCFYVETRMLNVRPVV